MKTLKRAFLVFLALTMACGPLVGCNHTPDTPDEPDVPDEPTPTKLSAPVLSVAKGSDMKVIWDVVENAVSYIVTVNGTDMPPQTVCSVLLTDDKEYTVTARAIAADTAYSSDASNELKLSYGFNEDAVVLRFAAISDVHVSDVPTAGKVVT